MDITIVKPATAGKVNIIPSKSVAHRLLIAAYLSGIDISDAMNDISKDIDATKACLRGLSEDGALKCGESGSTLRFLIPVAGALGADAVFHAEGRLPDRPLDELEKVMREHGCTVARDNDLISVSGSLMPGRFVFPGNVSSQYVTGMLFALPLLDGDSVIEVTGKLQSGPYIDLTLDVLEKAGIGVDVEYIGEDKILFKVKGNRRYNLPEEALENVEGDWSNGAFFKVMDAVSEGHIECAGLDPASRQGDRRITEYLNIVCSDEEVVVDVSDIPDLVPPLAVLAAARKKGTVTRIVNAARLRLKESDRLRSVAGTLECLGGKVDELPDGLIIYGSERLKGGSVDPANDHRIVMMAAVLACICDGPVRISGAEAVGKSYPGFFDEYVGIGGVIK